MARLVFHVQSLQVAHHWRVIETYVLLFLFRSSDGPGGKTGIEKDKDSEMIIPMSDLFCMYERFCKKNRFLKDDTKATSSRAFIGKLTELEIPIVKYKTMGNNSIKFVPEEVYDYLDKRRWINGYKDDENEMLYVDEGDDAIDGYFD